MEANITATPDKMWVASIREKTEIAAKTNAQNEAIAKDTLEEIRERVKQLVGGKTPRDLARSRQLPWICRKLLKLMTPLKKCVTLVRGAAWATARIHKDRQLVKEFTQVNHLTNGIFEKISRYIAELNEYVEYWQFVARKKRLPMWSKFNDRKIFSQIFEFLRREECSYSNLKAANDAVLRLISKLRDKAFRYEILYYQPA